MTDIGYTMYEIMVMFAGEPQTEMASFIVYFVSVILTCILVLFVPALFALIANIIRK